MGWRPPQSLGGSISAPAGGRISLSIGGTEYAGIDSDGVGTGLLATTDPWAPDAVVAETFPRVLIQVAESNSQSLTSGTMRLAGGMIIPAGQTVHSIRCYSGSTDLATGTHQWFCLVDKDTFEVLAVTADDTSTAWPASTAKTLVLADDYTPDADIAVYVGIVVVAGTMPTLTGLPSAVFTAIMGDTPLLGGQSGATGLTTPVAVGTVITAPSSAAAPAYCQAR